jgi:DNA mismatch repair protein MutS
MLAGCSSSLLAEAGRNATPPKQLRELLQRALVDNPPHVLHDGGVIREGYDAQLDEIRGIRATADTWRLEFEAQERQRSGISSLKVKSNNVIGFFIEVPTSQGSKVPTHYVRRQSTANAERFTTPELKQHEDAVITAVDRQIKREQELFTALRNEVARSVEDLRRVAGAVALLDCGAALAVVAENHAWSIPEIVEEPILEIERGRHPIIASLLEGAFIPNSVSFMAGGPTCFVVTGPNMGGKSTYLRQTALIALLAQMGCPVPADKAVVGIIDRVFARLGATDDLHEGESTFMVEMREASHILAHASSRSLVLIDELGRGTATSDGLSLAQAILEKLAFETRSRTLFATHYHEITALEEGHREIANLSVGSVEQDDAVIFTHEIQRGPAPRSYGLEVAKLSGLPAEVIARAYEVLGSLPQGERPQTVVKKQVQQPELFAPRAPATDTVALKLKERIEKIDVDSLSARDALSLVYELKELGSVSRSSAVLKR